MLFISSKLKDRYYSIFEIFRKEILITEIPNTKDIWVRDFMPIQSVNGNLILFKYWPKYLRSPKYQHLISDNVSICEILNLVVTYVDIILDGGSIVYDNDLYFISERIFKDNPQYNKEHLYIKLVSLFQTEKIIFIPEAKHDFTGHLDGVLSILDSKTILINSYPTKYLNSIKSVLEKYKFNIEYLTYNPYNNRTYQSAKGIYINYLETEDYLFVPIFGQTEDDIALKQLSSLIPNKTISPIQCTELAEEGGLLHCISWEKKFNNKIGFENSI